MIKIKNLIEKNLKLNLFNLPTPSSITYSWNLGSILAVIMLIQTITGFLLSIHYISHPIHAFSNYILISKNIWIGFIIKYYHSSGVTLIFIIILIHIFRNINYLSYKIKLIWFSGLSILILLIMTAFLGYVLPWGQISIWGATVICNIFSSIPIIGIKIVNWIWGNFSVSRPTLNRFFSIHFITPILIIFLILIHLFLLHLKGSSRSINISPKIDKISFKKKFYFKDLNSIIIIILILNILATSNPTTLIDPENFNPANPLITPIHIIPEWYFLFAYAILRSIPNKIGGIIILILSITILFLFPSFKINNISKFNPLIKIKNIFKISSFLILTFIGRKPIERPFIISSFLFTLIYFISFSSCFTPNRLENDN